MTSELRLRDHTRPCEHGSLWAHFLETRKGRWWKEPECPGGREIVLERAGEGIWREVGGASAAD